MTLQLLPAEDLHTLRAIADKVGGDKGQALREQFKL
jgi:hypothetical protein